MSYLAASIWLQNAWADLSRTITVRKSQSQAKAVLDLIALIESELIARREGA
jgi:hypothetical protein